MYSKILVPLDSSKRAEAVLPHVESIARRYQATVIFLGIVEPLYIAHQSIYKNPLFDQQNLNHQMTQMETYLATIQEIFRQKHIKAERRIGCSRPVEGIIRIAEEEEVDLIAMSSHGRTGLATVFYGSVAAGVLHQIDRPLLLIRA